MSDKVEGQQAIPINNNHRRSSSANDAASSPSSLRRIPFVRGLGSFRRHQHPRDNSANNSTASTTNTTTAASSQMSLSLSDSTKKEYMLSPDLILRVDVVRGRNLTREDESNTPNPYVNVRCGGIGHRTDTLKKTSDPEWLCSFEFNLSSDVIGHKKRLRALKKNGLSITTYAKDRFSSIFLGQIGWPLDRLFQPNQPLAFDENMAKWYPISANTSSRQRHRRFQLRKSKNKSYMAATEDDSLTNSDIDSSEICVQYGLIYRNEQGTVIPSTPETLEEDWQYVLGDQVTSDTQNAITTATPSSPLLPTQDYPITSSTFGSRFKRSQMKKINSGSSITSLNSATGQPTRKKGLGGKFIRKNRLRKIQQERYAKFYSDVMGITFIEIENAKDLPPARNLTNTSFDMDPFVIVTYGTSTFRTRAIRHNLNPVWNEKLFFHVRNSETNYKIKFAVYDKDKFSGNDFVGSQELSIADIVQKMPSTPSPTPSHPEQKTGTYFDGPMVTDITPSEEIERRMGRHSIPLDLSTNLSKWRGRCHPSLTIRAKFVPYAEIRKMFWIALAKTCDADNSNTMSRLEVQTMLETLGSNISEATLDDFWKENGKEPTEDLTMDELVKSLESFMQMTDEQESEDSNLIIEQGQDVPVDPIAHSTKSPFFLANSDDEDDAGDYIGDEIIDDEDEEDYFDEDDYFTSPGEYDEDDEYDFDNSSPSNSNNKTPDEVETEADYEALAEAEGIQYIDGPLRDLQRKNGDDLITPAVMTASGTTTPLRHPSKPAQEKVIRLNECPICRKPNLSKRGQMDIVTHVATCAANDWTTVDRFLMGNFGTEAQAQRKWFVKLVNTVGYGRYATSKSNANIIVQDRRTGQLIDERMSVYVRLGMRLVYKGMRSGIQSRTAKKILANMSIKQGRRFDNPISKRDIPAFIKFHNLDMSEVLEPMEKFRTFNQFFYRKLKPGARPCESPENKNVAVSPADCRMMTFRTVDEATQIWIKGVKFSIAKLLDNVEAAKAYEGGGGLAIFRLAPQDYHRFHCPVDGVVTGIHHVQGQYYTVNPMAIRTTLDVYGDNKRDVVHMETEAFGKVAIVCIGAMMVGSIILTPKVGDKLARTDELGYFAFGGSTLVVLFEKNAIRFDEDLLENASNSLETLVRVGNHIGVHY